MYFTNTVIVKYSCKMQFKQTTLTTLSFFYSETNNNQSVNNKT